MVKIGGIDYPEEILKAFIDEFPITAKKLQEFLSSKTDKDVVTTGRCYRLPLDTKSRRRKAGECYTMLEAFYAGWNAAWNSFDHPDDE